jgi:hypothetical protein
MRKAFASKKLLDSVIKNRESPWAGHVAGIREVRNEYKLCRRNVEATNMKEQLGG